MRAVEFERFLKAVLELRGFRVVLTRITGDQGVDLVVTREGRIAVQAKGHTGRVGNDAVQ